MGFTGVMISASVYGLAGAIVGTQIAGVRASTPREFDRICAAGALIGAVGGVAHYYYSERKASL